MEKQKEGREVEKQEEGREVENVKELDKRIRHKDKKIIERERERDKGRRRMREREDVATSLKTLKR